MTMKASGAATRPQVIDRWDGGVGWIAHPEERMRRASHAVAADGRAWLIDPVDADGIDELVDEVGEVAGVVVLLDRHTRDAERVADRHDVPVYVPEWMDALRESIGGSVEPFRGELQGTGYWLRRVVNLPFWREAGLVGESGDTLVLADALGTAEYFRAGDEPLAVHPTLRLVPPRRTLGDLSPERVLVGHGEGVMENAGRALETALASARRRAPRAYANALVSLLS